MGNFFKDLINKHLPEGEEVDGVFQCQERECFDIVEIATYYEDKSMLGWTCEEGHENKLEGFDLG